MSLATLTGRTGAPVERLVVRHVFETWSVEIPASFDETFVDEDAYWHAYDDERSISLTSLLIRAEHGPVRAESMMAVFPVGEGEPIPELPPAVLGWAVKCDAIQPARARRCISGVVAVDGRILLTTITSDDTEWARRTWLSIRHHPAVPRRRRR
jgi:hypothetical protein